MNSKPNLYKPFTIVIFLLIFVSFCQQLSAQPVTTITDSLNVFPIPDETAQVQLTLPRGHTVLIIDSNEKWLKIKQSNGDTGWIQRSISDRGITIKHNSPPHQSSANQRYALIIGNSQYKNGPLANPVNDAYGMAMSLQKLGFSVTHLENATQNEMIEAISQFGQQLTESRGVGIFYYAGHGIQIGGRNYLIPIGANIKKEHDAKYEAVDVGRILDEMDKASNQMNVVILDACRDNPFARSFRSSGQGLAQLDAPSGTLIAYATSPGKVASDGVGNNGIYTKYLLTHMMTPGISIEETFKRVRAGVMQETQNQQLPWESSSLIGNFYFIQGDKPPLDLQRPIVTPVVSIAKPVAPPTIPRQPEKPWYKRWYIWAAVAILFGAIAVYCDGGGDGGSRGQGGSGGGCSF